MPESIFVAVSSSHFRPGDRLSIGSRSGDKGHILVVDDDQEICDLVRDYLADEGYRVSTARGERQPPAPLLPSFAPRAMEHAAKG